MTGHRVDDLVGSDVDEVTAVLADAFAAYPTTDWFFGEHPLDRHAALAALMRFFVTARVLRGEPLIGVRMGGEVVAVALVSLLDGRPAPDAVAAARDALWEEVGTEVRRRYEAYGAALAPLLAHPGSVHLNVLGVRPAYRGQGLARCLLDHVHRLATRIPDSRGVSLATEDPANVALYERFGYVRLGSVQVAPGVTSWAMRRRADAAP